MLSTTEIAQVDFEKQLNIAGWRIRKDHDGAYENPTVRWMWYMYQRGFILAAENGYKIAVDKVQV